MRKVWTYRSRVIGKMQILQEEVVIVHSKVHGSTRYRSVVHVEGGILNNQKHVRGIPSQSTTKSS
jgi:hypothetical protein